MPVSSEVSIVVHIFVDRPSAAPPDVDAKPLVVNANVHLDAMTAGYDTASEWSDKEVIRIV